MRNIKLVLAYDGTAYSGWQIQKNQPTIQDIVQKKIGVMVGEPCVLNGAGRTDAGVHALGMVGNFITSTTIPCSGFRKGLNSLLPDDIRVLDCTEVNLDFHARKCAVKKMYAYNFIISEHVLPTERLYWAHFPGLQYFDAMKACLDSIVGEHDFSSFEATGSRDKESRGRGAKREIFSAYIKTIDKETGKFCIEVLGDGFLRHMVRNIVGTVVEVGYGKQSVQDFMEIIKAKDRSKAGPTAPAKGLFLKKIYY